MSHANTHTHTHTHTPTPVLFSQASLRRIPPGAHIAEMIILLLSCVLSYTCCALALLQGAGLTSYVIPACVIPYPPYDSC